jgi:hypothetical protein
LSGRRAPALVWILLGVVLLTAAGCRRGTSALGDLPYYPNATVVGTTTFEGEAFGFPRASWEQIELRTTAPFADVRTFYARVTIRGWTSTFESEVPKFGGRSYLRLLADNRRRQYYVIAVDERKSSKDVSILLRRGLAR